MLGTLLAHQRNMGDLLCRFVILSSLLIGACSPDVMPRSFADSGVDSGPSVTPPVDSGPQPGFDAGPQPGFDSGPMMMMGVDANMPPTPTEITAHVSDSCDLTVFAGYSLYIGTVATTCGNTFGDPGAVVNLTIGDASGAPPAGGRTYNLMPPMIEYPADGMASGSVLGGSSGGNIDSGTVTITPEAGGTTFTGSYSVMVGGTPFTGTFRSDHCPLDPLDCGE